MGYDQRTFRVIGHVSRHNSPKDAVHDALWDLLVARIREALDDKAFEPLNLIEDGANTREWYGE